MRTGSVLLGAVVLLAACGKTNADAIDALRPLYAPRRASLAALATTLPAIGTVTAGQPAPLSPPIVFDQPNDTFNTEVLMWQHLSDPDGRIGDEGIDLLLSDALLRCMRWTGPQNPMSASAMDDRNGETIQAECTAALAHPYLLILRQAAFQPPRIVSTTEFAPGALLVEAFVVRTADSQVATSFHVTAQTATTVRVPVDAQGVPTDAAISAIRSTLWSDAIRAVGDALRTSGATFVNR